MMSVLELFEGIVECTKHFISSIRTRLKHENTFREKTMWFMTMYSILSIVQYVHKL